MPKTTAMEPLAQALCDHYRLGHSVDVEFRRDDGVWYAQSTEQYFSVPDWLVDIEYTILSRVDGTVLDIGAASGRHALALQSSGYDVTAIDACRTCVELMTERGVHDARAIDVFDLVDGEWDTVIFMMETIGLAGTLAGLHQMLTKLKSRLRANGRILFDARPLQTDSSAEGSIMGFVGELTLQMRYRNTIGDVFRWLYIDQTTLQRVAEESGWQAEIIATDAQTQAYACELVQRR